MDVCLLEQRISELEHLILGSSFSQTARTSKNTILDQLYEVHKQVKIAERRAKVKEMLDRTNEIRKYVDPQFMDDVSLSNTAKIRLILAQEPEIVKTAQALESLQSLKDVLNHSAYADLPALKAKFAVLLEKHADQQKLNQDLIDESNELLQTYADTTDSLSKILVAWHKRVPSVNK